MRKIDAFTHILPRPYLDRLERRLAAGFDADRLAYYQVGIFHFDETLVDLDARFRLMDGFDDYAQVLTLAVPPPEEVGPPAVAADLARFANEQMAELVLRHPDRFVGFAAALPMNDVDLAVRELERAVGEQGALGAQIFSNVNGLPLDDRRFDALYERVEALGKMLWLHPTRSARWPDYPTEELSDYGLWWSLGWPYETGAALSRLVYSGVMERHPDLRLLAHHGGGMVPHFAARLSMGPGHRQTKDSLARPALDYFRRFYVDTALFGAPHAVRCALEFFGPDHVLFGSDVPLGPPGVIETTLRDIEATGLSRADQAAVLAGNATRLFGISQELSPR